MALGWRVTAGLCVPEACSLSALAVTTAQPSGLKAAGQRLSVWPWSWRSSWPVCASQRRAVWSALAVTTDAAVGLVPNQTLSVWPWSWRSSWPVCVPEACGFVGAGGDDSAAIGAEGRGPSPCGPGLAEFVTSLCVPETCGLVGAGGDDSACHRG